MFRFDANISILYQDLPIDRRAARAKADGFELVEMWWPSTSVLGGLTALDAAERIRAEGVRVEQLNLFGGDTEAGDRGLLTDPSRVDLFRQSIPDGMRLAQVLGARKVHVLTGRVPSEASRDDARRMAVDELRMAADILQEAGITVLVEPLNVQDAPGYLLPDVPEALALIREVDRPNVAIQLDVYHVAMANGDPVREIERAGAWIGHVQLADVPGRHEPGTGSLDFAAILSALSTVGYKGAVGLEFEPAAPGRPDFTFLSEWLA